MDRLTDRTRNHGIYLTGQNRGATGYVPDDVLKRLADLEDILFAPDGTQRITLERLSELVTAEQDVVFCRECMYRQKAKVNRKGFLVCPASGMEITDDDFCSYGERREPPKGE